MGQNISKERATINEFINLVSGKAIVNIHRADGKVEGPFEIHNQVAKDGLNNLAARSIVTSYAAFNYIAVGSGTSAGSLGSAALVGEVSRKLGATQVTSRSTIILSNTWGGAADTISSVALDEAGIFNAAAGGTMLNLLTGVNATLADSDVLSLEMTFQIGSHAL